MRPFHRTYDKFTEHLDLHINVDPDTREASSEFVVSNRTRLVRHAQPRSATEQRDDIHIRTRAHLGYFALLTLLDAFHSAVAPTRTRHKQSTT